MGIKQTLDVIKAMERDGVIERYAIGGAVAAYTYIEPAVTEDLDILVSFKTDAPTGLLSLEPVFKYLRARGFAEFRKEGVMVGGWPVQFLPVASPLDDEALAKAEHIDMRENGEKVRARILSAEHVVATAVQVGRPKDSQRAIQFLSEKAVNLRKLKAVLDRHNLMPAWKAFCRKSGVVDPIGSK